MMLQSCEICNYYTGSSPADTDRQTHCHACTQRKCAAVWQTLQSVGSRRGALCSLLAEPAAKFAQVMADVCAPQSGAHTCVADTIGSVLAADLAKGMQVEEQIMGEFPAMHSHVQAVVTE